MNANEVLKLIEAGFTKEEILNLESGVIETKPEQPEAKPEQPEAKPEQPETKPENAETVSRLDDIISKLETVTSTIQANALKNTNLPDLPPVDDYLASIIDPQHRTS